MRDLFEFSEEWSTELRAVIEDWQDEDVSYINCDGFVTSLRKIGYNCDYGLDATPFDLVQLSLEEIIELNKETLSKIEYFIDWVNDGNVLMLTHNIFSTQDSQFANKLKGLDNLINYFNTEFA